MSIRIKNKNTDIRIGQDDIVKLTPTNIAGIERFRNWVKKSFPNLYAKETNPVPDSVLSILFPKIKKLVIDGVSKLEDDKRKEWVESLTELEKQISKI